MNKAHYKRALSDQPKDHRQAVEIVCQILKAHGWSSELEVFIPLNLPELGLRNYRVDILASRKRGKELERFIVEIDGESHDDPKRKRKDKIRDTAFTEQLGLRTVRIEKFEILGGSVRDFHTGRSKHIAPTLDRAGIEERLFQE